MSSASSGRQPQARHHRHVLHLQFVAVVGALAVIEIELIGKSLLGVILGTNIFFLVRAIRPRALARVVNPADEVVVVRLFADAREVRGEMPPCSLVAFADGMAGEAAARLKQFFAVRCIAGLLFGQRIGESGLPDVGRDRLNLMVVQAEVRHLRRGTEIRRLLQPHWNPILVELQPDVFQVRADLFQVLHQAVRLVVELLQTGVQLAIGDPAERRPESFRWLASSFDSAASACFIRYAVCLMLSFF